MSDSGKFEIGWKKELLQSEKGSESLSGYKKSEYQKLSSQTTSSDSSDSSSDSSQPNNCQKKRDERKERRKRKKEEKNLKKEKRKQEKALLKTAKKIEKNKLKEEKKLKKSMEKLGSKIQTAEDYSVPIELMSAKAHVPETKEEYETRRNRIRRIVDSETGRTRLIKGDGEILEEIVSKEQHKKINKLATKTDGNIFQAKTIGWKTLE